ncbi:MAG: hypothetical protein GXO79_14900 [Chlorobi bacterium]|nr:hypothetical protein [Chlorobiota bacterium]
MEVYFHVGLPRAASTFLQHKVFPKFRGIEFIKKHNFKYRDKIISESKSDKILLSTEMDIGKENRYDDLIEVSKKFPNSKTILVLRKHDSWIKSKYYYFIRKHGYLDFDEFFNFNDTGFFKIRHLEYKRKIEIIENLYNHKPYIIFQEDLTKDSLQTLRKLATYIGISFNERDIKISKVNKSFSQRQLQVLLSFNKKLKNWPEKTKYFNFLYKSLRNLMIRIVVLLAGVLNSKKNKISSIIPPESLKKISEFYTNDWNYCIEYSKNN